MTNWELNYDIILGFQTNHGRFKLLKGNISCDLKILKCCGIFGYLVLSFLCLFEFSHCVCLTPEQMAGIFVSESCSYGGGWRILQLQQRTLQRATTQRATATGKWVQLFSSPAQATNQLLFVWAGACASGETVTHCHWPCTSLLLPMVHVEVEVQRDKYGIYNGINMFWLHK